MNSNSLVRIHFSDYFGIPVSSLESINAFNISLINDLPLFIDPFLLFNSTKKIYQNLHMEIIKYLQFLREKSLMGGIRPGLINSWFTFPEVKQTWLGFSETGNSGRGLGKDFAHSLNKNLNTIFTNFGKEQITQGSHLEKLCLIKDGVGKDNISDFTTNLIKDYLLSYTEDFTKTHISATKRSVFSVQKVRFNYFTESWENDNFELPYFQGDYVLLTPRDLLTRDDIWINKDDLVNDFDSITISMPNQVLRDQINNYFLKIIPEEPTQQEKKSAVIKTLRNFPELVEYYIKNKEENGDLATAISQEKVTNSEQLFIDVANKIAKFLSENTDFYSCPTNTLNEAKERAAFLKDFIENKGGHKLLYYEGKAIKRERDLQLLFKLAWFGTKYDVSSEVNDGRGPADFKVSQGSSHKTIIEFKLATNSHLKQNLENQIEVYKKASSAKHSLIIIFYFSEKEYERVMKIIHTFDAKFKDKIILIDARNDNKPSASVA